MPEPTASSATDNQPVEKKSIGGDLVIPIAGVAFAIYYFTTIIDTRCTAQVSAFFVGSVLILLVAIFLVKTFIQYSKGTVDLGIEPLIKPRAFVPKRLALFALTLGYCYFVHYGGFTLTTFMFLAGSMLVLTEGRKAKFILPLSAVIAITGWALFILAFHTRFPVGPFERLMNGLM